LLTERGKRALFAFGLRDRLRLEREIVERFLEGRRMNQQSIGTANREGWGTCELRSACRLRRLGAMPQQECEEKGRRAGRRPHRYHKRAPRSAGPLFDLQRFRSERAKLLQITLELVVIKNGHDSPPWHTGPRAVWPARSGSARLRYSS